MGVIASLPALFPRVDPEVVDMAAETRSDVTAAAETRSDVTVAETRCNVTAAVTRSDVTVAETQSGVTAAETRNRVTVLDEGNVGIIADQVTAGTMTFNLGDARSEVGRCMATLASDYAGNKDRNPKRVSDTCNWFLGHAMFRDWPRDRSKNLLWVSADPGCGKSVLSRALVDEGLLKSDISDTTCYFFFKEDDINRRTGADALCAILHQLFIKKPALLSKHALEPWRNNGENIRTQFGTLWDILMRATADHDEDDNACWVVCVLDALDECEQAARTTLVERLGRFHLERSQKKSRLKFIVTSRPYAEIQAEFGYNTGDLPHIHLKGETESEVISQEIDLYIEDQIPRIARARDPPLSKEIQARLVERLKEAENRTYLWLHLVIQEIKTSLEYTTKRLERVLEGLPTSVSHAYQNILEKVTTEERGGERIPNPRRIQEVKRLLHLIVAAARPLTVREMRIAVELLEKQDSEADEPWQLEDDLEVDDPVSLSGFANKIRNLCGLFVNVMDSKIYLIHQTAKEFLVANNPPGFPHAGPEVPGFRWKHSLWPPESHMVLASACMLYLLLFKLESPGPDTNPSAFNNNRILNIPDDTRANGFLDYTARHWAAHTTKAEETRNQSLNQLALRVCTSAPGPLSSPIIHSLYRLFPPPSKLDWADLAVASHLGLTSVVRLLAEGREIAELSYALYMAIKKGHEGVVQVLLEHGVSASFPFAPSVEYTEALHAAAAEGHENIARLLLDNGFPINIKDAGGRTALHLATLRGEIAMVRFLIERNADLDIQASDKETALSTAMIQDYWDVAELLLKAGADARIGRFRGISALYFAAQGCQESIVRSLLVSGHAVDDEAWRLRPWTSPLSKAARCGHEGMVRLLLENGAAVDGKSRDESGMTPLIWAAANGHEGVARLLLANGADVGEKTNNGATPLMWASREGHESVVRLLLANGADVGEKTDNAPPRLIGASKGGHESVVRLLPAKGARVDESARNILVRFCYPSADEQDGHPNALQLASREGHTPVVELLVQHGADINSRTEKNETALILAAIHRRHKTARCLVEWGADIDAKGRYGMTALAWATRNKDQGLVEFLTMKAGRVP